MQDKYAPRAQCAWALAGLSAPVALTLAGLSWHWALLGAAALGDIGKLFPDNDDRFLGADSIALLREVCRVLEEDYRICNVDCTVLAQRPKLAPHILTMRENLSAAMGLPLDCVSVKATTEEGLGFTGEGLGIAAHAVALIEKTK